ncbi:hypothetical protein ABZ942_06700 [Nocardia sp. NPDC046473]
MDFIHRRDLVRDLIGQGKAAERWQVRKVVYLEERCRFDPVDVGGQGGA